MTISSTDIYELINQFNSGVLSETELLLAFQLPEDLKLSLQRTKTMLRPEVLMKLTIDDYVADGTEGPPVKKSKPFPKDTPRNRYFGKMSARMCGDIEALDLARVIKISYMDTEDPEAVEYLFIISDYATANVFARDILGATSPLKKNRDDKYTFTVEHHKLYKLRLVPPTTIIETP
jgi:hypothetical protein